MGRCIELAWTGIRMGGANRADPYSHPGVGRAAGQQQRQVFHDQDVGSRPSIWDKNADFSWGFWPNSDAVKKTVRALLYRSASTRRIAPTDFRHEDLSLPVTSSGAGVTF